MPFNKGDFTQQGVAGHVNAILRLNEKRYVGIDLTSNEEAEGCTIAGAVYDLLNEEVYPVGAGVSGNIEITENGENINVAPYATATVNVAGDSIPKCTVNVINNTANNIYLDSLISDYKCIENNYFLAVVPPTPANDSANYTLLYVNDTDFYCIAYNSENMTLTNMVNCEVIAEGDWTGYISPIDETLDSSFTLTIDPVPPID